MDRCENNLDSFINLITEYLVAEKRKETPEEFLLNLWRTDKDCFYYVIRGSLKYMRSIRGMDSCIINVCMSIGNETRDLLEEIALRRRGGSKWSDGFLTSAILLGSTKALDKFKQGFEESFASGVRHYYSYKQVEALEYLKTIIFLKLSSMPDIVAKLASMKNDQNHRINKPSLGGIFSILTSEKKEQRLNKLDQKPIKYAEAINVYFTKGSGGIKKYLETTRNTEYRAEAYLFCLACDRNPDNFDYFRHQYTLYDDPGLKHICIEALVYVGDPYKTATFIDQELGKYNLNRLIKKRGCDFKVITIRAHESLFYYLLESCYFLKTLNESIIRKLQVLSEAREATTSNLAKLILEKFKIITIDKKRISTSQEILLSSGSLLSMAKSSGQL